MVSKSSTVKTVKTLLLFVIMLVAKDNLRGSVWIFLTISTIDRFLDNLLFWLNSSTLFGASGNRRGIGWNIRSIG